MKNNIGLTTIHKKEVGEVSLVTTERFAGLDVDFYRNKDNEVFMTRKQIGEALGYADPTRAMSKIHERNKGRLDEFSTVVGLRSANGKLNNTTLYNENGIKAILQLSDRTNTKKIPILEHLGEKVYYPVERDEHKYLQVIMDTFRDKETKREHVLGDYRTDLVFPNEKILVECDEYGHKRYCQNQEKERELFLENQGYTIIRFNPNEKNFRIGLVIAEILDVFKNKGVL